MRQMCEQVADQKARETAENVRENAIENLSKNRQGEAGIIEYVGEVKQSRNELGQFMSTFEFVINHPTAKLHERGGEIEPTYARAMAEGWDRDGFYEGLIDCNYYVKKKRFMRRAVQEAMRQARR
jgi:hypothetical protein